jgi:hypothetical protein
MWKFAILQHFKLIDGVAAAPVLAYPAMNARRPVRSRKAEAETAAHPPFRPPALIGPVAPAILPLPSHVDRPPLSDFRTAELAAELHDPSMKRVQRRQEGEMASALFQSYERTLRRVYMMNLVETVATERNGGFKASLVVNARTGHPIETVPEQAERRRLARSAVQDAHW